MPTHTPPSWPQLRGLDATRGLRLFCGQVAVYREALHDFVQLYGHGLPGVEAYLDNPTDEHFARARREVHAAGGAAAALGAIEVERLAQEFEAGARQPQGAGADPAIVLAGWRRELSALTAMLRAWLDSPSGERA